jgi:hypothetical protein
VSAIPDTVVRYGVTKQRSRGLRVTSMVGRGQGHEE